MNKFIEQSDAYWSMFWVGCIGFLLGMPFGAYLAGGI